MVAIIVEFNFLGLAIRDRGDMRIVFPKIREWRADVGQIFSGELLMESLNCRGHTHDIPQGEAGLNDYFAGA